MDTIVTPHPRRHRQVRGRRGIRRHTLRIRRHLPTHRALQCAPIGARHLEDNHRGIADPYRCETHVLASCSLLVSLLTAARHSLNMYVAMRHTSSASSTIIYGIVSESNATITKFSNVVPFQC